MSVDVHREMRKIFALTEINSNNAPRARVFGFIEVDGEVVPIRNLKQLIALTATLDYEHNQLPKEVRQEAKLNMSNRSMAKNNRAIAEIDIKDFDKEECYDATVIDVWSFKKSDGIKDGLPMPFGNQCSGFDYEAFGQHIYTSENLYLCGQFSDYENGDREHLRRIQQQILSEPNGYTAKKKVKNANKDLMRSDWDTSLMFNWMLLCVWLKCVGNEKFRSLLLSLPPNSVIVEDSTNVGGTTSLIWGAKNEILDEARRHAQRLAEIKSIRSKDKKATTQEKMLEASNNLYWLGEFKGKNFMGKILMLCQKALLNDSQPPIDYGLLESRHIYILGEELSFLK